LFYSDYIATNITKDTKVVEEKTTTIALFMYVLKKHDCSINLDLVHVASCGVGAHGSGIGLNLEGKGILERD
jgi:hypothetical protein